jgi:hypothetical protein
MKVYNFQLQSMPNLKVVLLEQKLADGTGGLH